MDMKAAPEISVANTKGRRRGKSNGSATETTTAKTAHEREDAANKRQRGKERNVGSED